ncbi:MAG: hypothetical protein H6936_09890 [Burkholderiales bacterium]|nr:hypothetical protein [Nitrosomonas sp.]MCP5275143.1 hypothetical protein [Burkholderiales bacterium]
MFITVCLLAIPLLLGIFLYMIIDDQPHVEHQIMVTPEHIEHAKETFDQHRQHAQQNQLSTISVRPDDIDIAANYLAKHFTDGRARINIANQKAYVQTSLPIPLEAINGYINLEATLIETDALPQLESVSIGSIPIPDFISQFFVTQSIQWLQSHPKYGKGIEAIKSVKITPDAFNVLYQSQGESTQSDHFPTILSKLEQEKVYRYYKLLSQNKRQHAEQTLSQILQSLMQMAAQHSENSMAQRENRAAILAATFYVLGLPLKYVVPEAADWHDAHNQIVTLDGRQDFAQHFIVSAAITAYADTALSDAIGLYKEIEDKRNGSGFSFNDIAADRAGTRFGERATANQKEAVRLQQLIAQGLDDKSLMPTWSDLPEFLPMSVFRRQYGNFDTPAYFQMMEKIERRVEALAFLQ